MRGKRELPRKRPPILLFVLIFAAGFLAGTLFWHFHPSGTSVPSGGTVTLPDGPAGTDVSSEPEIPPAPPQMEELLCRTDALRHLLFGGLHPDLQSPHQPL